MFKNIYKVLLVCSLILCLNLSVYGLETGYVEDEIFIKIYDQEQEDDLFEYLNDGISISQEEKVFFKEVSLKHSIDNLYLFSTIEEDGTRKVLDKDTMAILRKLLKENEFVYYAQPNYKYIKKNVQGTDLNGFDNLWGFYNDGSNRYGQDFYDEREGLVGMDINVIKAWAITKGSNDVIVMIADDGLDANHLEFAGRVLQNDLFNPQEGVGIEDGYGDVFTGHGTHVAGIIGASWDEGEITGVAPLTTLMPINILSHPDDRGLNDAYASSDSAISSLYIAEEYGVKIINNSWGSERWTLDEVTGEKILFDDWNYDMVLREAILKVEDKILYVVAAGNDGHDNDLYPSIPDMFGSSRLGPDGEVLEALKNVISVAALDNGGGLTEFTNYGLNSVHISAPGWGIYSTFPLDEYTWFDGSSMAAPMVTGVGALMYAVAPDLRPEEIIEIMLETGKPLPYANDYFKTISNKMIDAYEAVSAAKLKHDENNSYEKASPWAQEEVKEAMQLNLVTENLMDNYQRPISRIDFSQMIVRFYEKMTSNTTLLTTENPFEDTNDAQVLKAYQLGIIKGISKTEFAPNDEITRQEIAVMFYRTLQLITPNITSETYELKGNDKHLVAPWAKEAVATMNAYEIIKGVGDNRLDPLGISSQEVAILLILRTYLAFVE